MNNPKPLRKTAPSGQPPGAKESPESIKALPLRAKKPGQVGLANETRPGLGTRAYGNSSEEPSVSEEQPPTENRANKRPAKVPKPPIERGERSEQDPTSLAQEQQRSTGVSGHAGGT
jgi:hypothetical protein